MDTGQVRPRGTARPREMTANSPYPQHSGSNVRAPTRSGRALVGGARGQIGRPLLLDAAVAPDRQRDRPRTHEQPDDRVTGVVERDARDGRDRAAGDVELVGQDTDELDRVDHE